MSAERTGLSVCPSDDQLDPFVETGAGDGLAAHVAQCAACRERVVEMRANNDFLRAYATRRRALAPTAAAACDAAPPEVPGCRIVTELGRGRQGVVYEALHEPTQRRVAIKVIREDLLAGPDDQARFEREVRILATLRHPNIVAIYDSGIVRGRRYYVMDLVRGRSLADHLRAETALGPRPRLELCAKICDAVSAAHLRGVIHRDLKPGNIVIDESGEPHILDFGLAKLAAGDVEATSMTMTGQFLGSPAWSAPEQADGDASRIDIRTDVYALGLILYHALTGAFPYDVSGSLWTVLQRVRHAQPLRMSLVGGAAAGDRPRRGSARTVRFDDDIETIVMKCLSKERERRYESAAALANEIRRYLAGQPIEAKRDSTAYVLRKLARRHRWPLALAAAALLVLLAFSVAIALAYRRAALAEIASSRKSAELAGLLRTSNVERGRAMALNENAPLAEQLLWHEFLAHFDEPPDRLPLDRSFWGLWELYSRAPCLRTWSTGSPIAAVAWSRDGDQLIALRQDGQVEALSLATGAAAGIANIASVGFPDRSDGQLFPTSGAVVVVMHGGTAEFVDLCSGRAVLQLELQRSPEATAHPSTLLAVAPNAPRFARADRGAAIEVCALPSGRAELRIESSGLGPEAVPYMVLSPDGRRLVTWRDDGLLQSWDVSGPVATAGRALADVSLLYLADISPDNHSCAFVIRNQGAIRLVDLDSNAAPRTLAGSLDMARALQFSPNGALLAASGNDRVVRLWNACDGTPRAALTGHESTVTHLAFNADGARLASLDVSGVLKVWDLTRLDPPPLCTAPTTVHSLCVVPDGRSVLTGDATGTLAEWDIHTGRLRRESRLGSEPVSAIVCARDGRRLAVGTYAGVACLIDRTRGDVLRTFDPPTPGDVSCVSISPDGSRFAVVGHHRAREIDLWETDGDAPPLRLSGHRARIPAVCFAPDGATLASTSLDGQVRLWNVQSGQTTRVIAGHSRWARCLCFSPDGGTLATGGEDWTIKLWDVASGACRRQLEGHRQEVLAVRFSPDGRLIASGDRSGVMMLWNAQTGENLVHVPQRQGAIFSLDFSPDGMKLASGSDDRTIRIQDLGEFAPCIAGNLEHQLARYLRDADAASMTPERAERLRRAAVGFTAFASSTAEGALGDVDER